MSKSIEEERDTLTLDEGLVTILRPKQLSPESLGDFEDFIEIVMRRARRTVIGHAVVVDTELGRGIAEKPCK